MSRIVEGQPLPPRRESAGNAKRYRPGQPIPALQFGQHGELTARTIRDANLSKAEEKRAFEMLKVQKNFLEIMDCLSYPVDPEGHVHDLSAIGVTKVAIAWTLALNGFQRTGKQYIKKRMVEGPGVYRDAHTWVDCRSPDTADEDLRPTDRPNDPDLPPDTRRLAAIRDGAPPQKLPDGWHTKPRIIWHKPDGTEEER
jgi:hypothetical protein